MGLIDGLIDWVTPNNKNIVAISDSTLSLLLELARESHPDEMLAILTAEPISEVRLKHPAEFTVEDPHIITGFDVPPRLRNSPTQVQFSPHMLPITTNTVGVVHSHPNGVLQPSMTDLNQGLSVGNTHIIIGAPYTSESLRAFNSTGERVSIDVLKTYTEEKTETQF